MIDRSKFHNSCASRAAPACGLPNELVEVFMKHEAGSPRPSVFHSTSLPYPGGGDAGSLAHASSVPAFNVRTSLDVTALPRRRRPRLARTRQLSACFQRTYCTSIVVHVSVAATS